MVEVRHLCRDRGRGEEETGDVVMETHPDTQVHVSHDNHMTVM